MNKPITQLELIPAPPIESTAASTPTSLLHKNKEQSVAEEIIAQATAALAQAGPDEFDWSADDSIVVKPRPGIAIYENRLGDVVVRTQSTDGDEDYFAYITPEGLPAVLKALKAYLP